MRKHNRNLSHLVCGVNFFWLGGKGLEAITVARRTYKCRMGEGALLDFAARLGLNTNMRATLHIAAVFVPAAELTLHRSCC